jgi:hypothetical protein
MSLLWATSVTIELFFKFAPPFREDASWFAFQKYPNIIPLNLTWQKI